MKTLRTIAVAICCALSASLAYGQSCGTPFTDNWSGTGALGSQWTTPVSTGAGDTLTKNAGQVVDAAGTNGGIAILNNYCGVYPATQQVQSTAVTVGNYTGLTVHVDASGNGYAWVFNANGVMKLTAGSGAAPFISCPAVSNGDTVNLSIDASNHIVCWDVTTNAIGQGTDGTYASGYPGVFVWQGFPLGPTTISDTTPTFPLSQPTIAWSTATFVGSGDGISANYPSIGSSPTVPTGQHIIIAPGNVSSVYYSGATPDVLCYRMDGVAPNPTTPGTCPPGSTTYTYNVANPPQITWSGSGALKVIGTAVGSTNSAVTTSNITVQPFWPMPGTYSFTPLVLTLRGAQTGNVIYTTDTSTPTADASCNPTHGTAIANGGTISFSTTTTVTADSCVGGVLTPLTGSPAVYTLRSRVTWYLRSDGGTYYNASTNPSGQCDGQTNAAAPGISHHCALKDFRNLYDPGNLVTGLGAWIIAGGDQVIVRDCAADPNDVDPHLGSCRIGWNNGSGGGPTNPWCPNIGNQGCYNPAPIPVGSASQPTEFDGANHAACATGGNTNPANYASQLATIFGGFGLYYVFDLSDAQYVKFACLNITDFNGAMPTFTGVVTNGSATITSVSGTTGLFVGEAIEIPGTISPIPAAAHIVSFTADSVTLDEAAVASSSGAVTITAVSTCSNIGDVHWPRTCVSSTGGPNPVDDFGNSGLLMNRNANNITFQDVWIHGFASEGIHGSFGASIAMTRVENEFNAFAGWNMDDGHSTPDGENASITGNYANMVANGCQEMPGRPYAFPALQCMGTQHAGFGDGWSGQDTILSSITLTHSNLFYNTKDGTWGPHVLSQAVDLEELNAVGNAGVPLKFISAVNGTFKLLNSEINGNCARYSDTVNPIPGAPQVYAQASGLNGAYMTNGDFCRANNAAIAANLRAGVNWLLANNTIVTNAADIQALDCGPAYNHPSGECGTATLTYTNNVFLGYYNSPASQGPKVLDKLDSTIAPVYSHNIEFGTQTGYGGTCGVSGEICSSPLLVSQPIQQAWTNQAYLDAFNYNLTSGSPAITAGTTYTGMLSTDYAGNTQTSPPTIGALVFSSGAPTAVTPTFSPVAGTYAGTQSVTISTTSSGAIICYTSNGSTPATNGTAGCTAGTLYSGPVSVAVTETLKAVAGGTGYVDSGVGSGAYVINGAAATPTCSPASGTYTSVQTVTCSSTTPSSTTRCTIDGSTPNGSSPVCTAITVNHTLTLKAFAQAASFNDSAVDTEGYTINLPVTSPAVIGGASVYGGSGAIQ